jgi:hypothetical protein
MDGPAYLCIAIDERDSQQILPAYELRINAHVEMLASVRDGCELQLSINPAELCFLRRAGEHFACSWSHALSLLRLFQRLSDHSEEFFAVARLVEEGECPFTEDLPANSIIMMRGDEDDGEVRLGRGDMALQLAAVHPLHADIGDQTMGHHSAFDTEPLTYIPPCRLSSPQKHQVPLPPIGINF